VFIWYFVFIEYVGRAGIESVLCIIWIYFPANFFICTIDLELSVLNLLYHVESSLYFTL
jgi:hypothetical protein